MLVLIDLCVHDILLIVDCATATSIEPWPPVSVAGENYYFFKYGLLYN